MKSMTGYGSAQFSSKDISLEVNIKCVNGRFLEFKINLPYEYNAIEAEIKKCIQSQISRGTISVYIGKQSGTAGRNTKAQVNIVKAQEWVKAYSTLGKVLKLKGAPSLDHISRIPDVISFQDVKTPSAREIRDVLKTVEKAVEHCDQERLREGRALQSELLDLIKSLSKNVDILMGLREEASALLMTNYQSRLKRLGFDGVVPDERIHHEIVLLIEKADIAEEIQRLKEHIRNIKGLVESRDSNGKKLDFYIQELLREMNTIGSKSPISKMTEAVVQSKSIIEKLREQIQNVE